MSVRKLSKFHSMLCPPPTKPGLTNNTSRKSRVPRSILPSSADDASLARTNCFRLEANSGNQPGISWNLYSLVRNGKSRLDKILACNRPSCHSSRTRGYVGRQCGEYTLTYFRPLPPPILSPREVSCRESGQLSQSSPAKFRKCKFSLRSKFSHFFFIDDYDNPYGVSGDSHSVFQRTLAVRLRVRHSMLREFRNIFRGFTATCIVTSM